MNTQAIIQILDDIAKESIESFGKSIEPDMYPTWIKTAKDRISSIPSIDNQWIDVKERLPEDGEIVTTYNSIGAYSQEHFQDGEFDFYKTKHLPITHWMPLPLPPND